MNVQYRVTVYVLNFPPVFLGARLPSGDYESLLDTSASMLLLNGCVRLSETATLESELEKYTRSCLTSLYLVVNALLLYRRHRIGIRITSR